jgi:hypothetical protein
MRVRNARPGASHQVYGRRLGSCPRPRRTGAAARPNDGTKRRKPDQERFGLGHWGHPECRTHGAALDLWKPAEQVVEAGGARRTEGPSRTARRPYSTRACRCSWPCFSLPSSGTVPSARSAACSDRPRPWATGVVRGWCITGAGMGLLLDAKFDRSRLPRRPVGELGHGTIARCGLCHGTSLPGSGSSI